MFLLVDNSVSYRHYPIKSNLRRRWRIKSVQMFATVEVQYCYCFYCCSCKQETCE
uniref:Uncharacterized protein n=1 Tax=Anguilla anguilla TaxID=7936 RepID=A0A0E9U0P9_ANGAN